MVHVSKDGKAEWKWSQEAEDAFYGYGEYEFGVWTVSGDDVNRFIEELKVL